MKLEKAVVTAAGQGSRMLPLTRGIRKEMLPLCSKTSADTFMLKPLVHLIFEQLYRVGIRSFCFVVRTDEHMIKDYFTLKESYIDYLKKMGRYTEELETLREMVSDSHIEFVNQVRPEGFGDAVLKSKRFVGDDDFLVHAGDGYLLHGDLVITRLMGVHLRHGSSATLVTRRVNDPSKYGVVSKYTRVGSRPEVYLVDGVVEKPKHPPTNMALTAVYAFKPDLMVHLAWPERPRGSQSELTDGIAGLIKSGRKVYAIGLREGKTKWLSVGSPEGYLRALEITRRSPA